MPTTPGHVLERSLSEEVIYGRPPDHLKVFLSSKMRGGALATERRVAIEAIDASPLHRAWAWERDAHAGPYSASGVCLANARTSDVLVLIVGDELTEMTKREYRAAGGVHVPRFVLIKEGAAPSPEVTRFIQREETRVVTNTFRNEAELRTQLQAALRAYAVRVHRMVNAGGLAR